MRLVFVTQTVDAGDPILGATVPKLRALAARFEEVVVVTDRVREHDLPPNCRLVTFGARSRARRGLRYLRILAPLLLARRRPHAILGHMCPIYVVLAAPLAKLTRVPLALWYTHPHASSTLRAASAVATLRLTADSGSFPLPAEARAIGHGIDVDAFACGPERPERRLDALALGRYSPVKGYAPLLRGFRRALDAGVDLSLTVHGPALNDAERRHRRELELLQDELGLADHVHLHEALPPAEARQRLAAADVLVSNTRRGSADKAVLEACASCVPALASTWASLLPERLSFEADDEAALAARLGELAALAPAERAQLGRDLRELVAARHSVDSWADAVVAAVREVRD